MRKIYITLSLIFVLGSALFAQDYRLVSPKQNYVFSLDVITATLPVGFEWSVVDNATSYELLVARDTLFTDVVFQDFPTTTLSQTALLKGTYFWKIRATTSGGTQAWSYYRKFSIFNPGQVQGLVMWFDAGKNVTSSAGAVSQWADLSPSSLLAVQNSNNNKPTLVANQLCNKPVIRFTGTGGASTSSNLAFSTLTLSNYTCLQVRSYVNNSNYMQYVIGGVGNGICAESDYYGGGFGSFSGSSGSDCLYASTSPQTPGFGIFSVQRDHVFKNGLEVNHAPANGNYNCFALQGISVSTLGARTDAVNLALSYQGDIGEIVMYDNSLDDETRLLAEQYLRYKFAPHVNLGHDTIVNKFCVSVTLSSPGCFASYLWSTGATTPTITATSFGEYSVRATDALGFVSYDTIRVRPQIPFNQLPPSAYLCAGDSLVWNTGYPANGYQFTWSNAATTPTLAIKNPGTYSVSIRDAFNCTYNSLPIQVGVDDFPNFSLGPDTSFCSGNRLNFLYPDSLTSIYWSTGDNTNETVILNPGNYSVIATNENGCIAKDTIYVSISGYAPTVNFTNPVLCATDSVLFLDSSIAPAGNTIVHYTWNFGGSDTTNEQNPTRAFATNGQYTISLSAVTDVGCVNSVSKTLSVYLKPKADFRSKIACALTETAFTDLSINTPPGFVSQWKWIFAGADTSASRNPKYTFNAPGKYEVNLMVANNNGCIDTKTDSVEVFAPFETNFSFEHVCLGDSTYFKDISQSYSVVSWLWDAGDNFVTTQKTFKHKYAASGDYTVILKLQNAIGCEDSIKTKVTIYPAPDAAFGHLFTCEDQYYTPLDSSIVFEAANTYKWTINGTPYNNTTNPQYFFADTGAYSVKLNLTSFSGCKDSVSHIVHVKPNPDAAFTFAPLYGDAPLNVTFTNQSKNADSYFWSFGDGVTDNVVNPAHTYTSNDTFTIKLVANSAYGCTDSAQKNIIIVVTDLDIAVDDVLTSSAPQPDGTVLVSVTGLLSNVGTRLITHMKLYATIGSGGVISEEVDTILQSGQTMAYSFLAHFVVAAENANSYVCVQAKSVNHDEAEVTLENNSECTSLTDFIQIIGPSPNPARSVASLGLILPKAGKVTIDIVNINGQVLMNEEVWDLRAGRSDYNLPISQLRAGEYFIRIKHNDDKLLRKLVIH